MKPSSSKAHHESDFTVGQFGLSNEQVVERVEIDQIKLPRSVRKIGARAIALCKANLQRFGQPGPILVSEALDLVHGEEMLLAAKELGWTAINVVRIRNLSDADRRVLTLALTKLPLLSSWDEDALRVEFSEIIALDLDYEIEDLTGFSTTEIDVVINPALQNRRLIRSTDCPIQFLTARPSAAWAICGNWAAIACTVPMP